IYVQSYKTAIVLGAARGAAILAAAENGLPVFEYSPRRIKQSTVGRGSAGKNQVAFMVRALLGLTETPDADAADALAIALTHLRAHETVARGFPGSTQIRAPKKSRSSPARSQILRTCSPPKAPMFAVSLACVGSAEWNSRARSRCRKMPSRKNGRIPRCRMNYFCSSTTPFTQLGGRRIAPAC